FVFHFPMPSHALRQYLNINIQTTDIKDFFCDSLPLSDRLRHTSNTDFIPFHSSALLSQSLTFSLR
ncbi:hypothetical protein, partial [Glaesserella parasuis]|uniref:hypothetical protein n=1 Tax=Glaesserella parasuis TaxID=738 RepID=UPI001BE3E6C5